MTKGKRVETGLNRHAMTFPGIIMESAKRKYNLLGAVRNGIAFMVLLTTFAGSFCVYLYALGAVIFPWNRLRKRRKGNMTKKMEPTTMGGRIKAQRIRIGYTQEQLAEIMCVPKSTISAYENDKVDIKSSVIVELSRHLAISPNYLFGFEEEQDPFAVSAASIIQSIKDEKIKALLVAQLQVAGKMGM